jgi:hypothetical protein
VCDAERGVGCLRRVGNIEGVLIASGTVAVDCSPLYVCICKHHALFTGTASARIKPRSSIRILQLVDSIRIRNDAILSRLKHRSAFARHNKTSGLSEMC